MIKLRTSAQLLTTVAKRWESSYHKIQGGWGVLFDGRDTGDIYAKLLAASSLEEAEEAIGNNAWTRVFCEECHEMVNTAAFLGNGEEGDNPICYDCLKKALTALDKYNIYGKIPDTEAQE